MHLRVYSSGIGGYCKPAGCICVFVSNRFESLINVMGFHEWPDVTFRNGLCMLTVGFSNVAHNSEYTYTIMLYSKPSGMSLIQIVP